MSALRKQILREFPELAAGYHLPIAAEVLAIPDAPAKGGVSDGFRPRLAVDVVLLDHDYQQTTIRLDAVPVSVQGGGDERGFFALPPAGTVVELAWLNGNPERPFVRSILGDRQALPWLNSADMAWQQAEGVSQRVDAAGNWQRTTHAGIHDQAHQLTQDIDQVLQSIGNEIRRVREHSTEDIDGTKRIEAGAIHQLSLSVLNLLAMGSINQATAEHATRSAAGDIRDKATGQLQLIGSKVELGNGTTNVLQLLADLIGELTTALNAISTMTVGCTSPGTPSTPPINAASFVSAATKLTTLKTTLSTLI